MLSEEVCKFVAAIAAYDEASSLDPSNLSIRSNKAAALLELGKIDEAIEVCLQALKIEAADDAQRAKVCQRLATAYSKAGDQKRGEEEVD